MGFQNLARYDASMRNVRFSIPEDAVVDFCRRHGIRRLSLFGSVLRMDFRPESDIDVLVEFDPATRIGLIGMAAIENELSDLVGRKVDLRTPADLGRHFRDRVVEGAEVLYAA